MSSTTKKKLKPNLEVKVTPKKVSKTWLAYQNAINNPGLEILDIRAVLK
jgi:hypothetical protein